MTKLFAGKIRPGRRRNMSISIILEFGLRRWCRQIGGACSIRRAGQAPPLQRHGMVTREGEAPLQQRHGAAVRARIVVFLAVNFAVAGASRSQEMSMPASQEHAEHHHHGDIKPVEAHYPQIGRAQVAAQGALVTLEQVEGVARQMNPTLRQAEAEIRAAKARQQQVGLYPNPTVGYTGDEIRGGSVGGGKEGFFVQQTIVTAGKLGLSRDVLDKETKLASLEADEQRIRVESAVRMAFLRVLAAQEMLDARGDLAKITQDNAETQRRLLNTGQADETEVLEAEVDAQRMRIAARMQENTLREEWRSLTSVIGQPDLPMAT